MGIVKGIRMQAGGEDFIFVNIMRKDLKSSPWNSRIYTQISSHVLDFGITQDIWVLVKDKAMPQGVWRDATNFEIKRIPAVCPADKEDFIGREAIINQKANGVTKKLVGLALAEDDKAIPRHGYEVEAEGKKIGYVTTGYRTIMTDKSVCFALIDAAYKDLGTKVQISIHRKLHEATVVKRKFYEKNYKK